MVTDVLRVEYGQRFEKLTVIGMVPVSLIYSVFFLLR